MQPQAEALLTIIVVVVVLVFLAILLLVILARHNARKNQLLYQNEQIRLEFEHTLSNTRMEIQEQTLNHVSREIHDNIGQALSLIRLQLNTIEPETTEENLKLTDELLEKAISDLRALSHSLNTNHITEKGFTESLKHLLAQLQKTGKYEINFFANRDFEVSDETGIILYRIVQELLNNVIKHANATKIDVVLEDSAGSNSIKITDNGVGFDSQSPDGVREGIGLKNMKDRSKVIGAQLLLSSMPGKGTTAEIIF